MRFVINAACAIGCAMPILLLAQENGAGTVVDIEEIVVVGRSVSTSSAVVSVEREILVDTANVLKDIPGANVNSNGPITGIAQYRGMYGDRVAVDVDGLGVISGGPNAMDTPLSYVSPMITEQLVLSRGIASVSAAPESVGGYIGTKVSRGDFAEGPFEMSGVVGARYSDNGNVSTSLARLTLADDTHRVSALAEFDDGGNIDTPEGEIRTSALSRERYDLSYAYRNGDTHFMGYAGKLDTTDTGTPALPMDILLIGTDLFGARFGFNVSPTLAIEGRLGYNTVEHVMNNYALRQPPMLPMYRENTATGKGSQFSLAGRVDRGTTEFRLGIDGIQAEHNSVITNPNAAMFRVDNFSNVSRDLLGAFAEWRRPLAGGSLEAGVRYKRISADAGEVGAAGMMGVMATNVGTLADSFNTANRDLSWNTVDAVIKYQRPLSGESQWNLQLGSKTRAPSYQELYLWLPLQAAGGLADGRTYIGDLGLKEERSNELVLGLTSDFERFGFSPQLFYRQVNGYIQGTPSDNMLANMVSTMMTGAPPLQFANVDARIWGVDGAWRYQVSDSLLLDGVVSITRGRRTDIADNLYRLSPYNGSLGLTYSAASWTVKTEVIGNAKQDYVSAYNGEQQTNGYWLVNTALTWNPLASLRVEARIDNLLDESYQDHVTGINRAGGSEIAQGIRLFGAKRTISVGLLYSF